MGQDRTRSYPGAYRLVAARKLSNVLRATAQYINDELAVGLLQEQQGRNNMITPFERQPARGYYTQADQ